MANGKKRMNGFYVAIISAMACYSLDVLSFPSNRLVESASNINRVVNAYFNRDGRALEVHKGSNWRRLSLFSNAASARLRGKELDAEKYLQMCVDERIGQGLDGYLRFSCLWSLAGVERGQGKYQEYYRAKIGACTYLATKREAIVKGTSRELPGLDEAIGHQVDACRHLGYMSKPTYLPKTSFSLDEGWDKIKIDNGYVSVVINGSPVSLLIDTGDGEIAINCNEYASVCNGMKRIGIRHPVDDFYRTFLVEDKVADTLIFGPLAVKNAYIPVTYDAPSTIGIQYLKRLHKFTVGKDELVRDGRRDDGQCSKFSLEYGALSAMAPQMMVGLKTNVGDFRLLLDTGSVTGQGMPAASLFLYEKSAARSPRVKDGYFHHQHVSMRQHGNEVSWKVNFFHFGINGVDGIFNGLVWPHDSLAVDRSDGVMGADILRHTSMYMNFDDREICFQ